MGPRPVDNPAVRLAGHYVAYHLLTPDSQSVVITVIVPPTAVSTVEYQARPLRSAPAP